MKAEQELISAAIAALDEETGLVLEQMIPSEGRTGGEPGNFVVRIRGVGESVPVIVRDRLAQAPIGVVMKRLNALPSRGLLIADYVSPPMARRLREDGVQFVDTAGNAWIDRPPVFVSSVGRPRARTVGESAGSRSHLAVFEPRAMVVIYALLVVPGLIAKPYRAIAELTGASVGTVGRVMKGLAAEGLAETSGRVRRIDDDEQRTKLIARWVEAWPSKLRTRQYVGTYVAADPDWFDAADLSAYAAYGGGELAGAFYTRFLEPRTATVYVRDSDRVRLMRDARLRKAGPDTGDPGSVDVLRPFWSPDLDAAARMHPERKSPVPDGLVHPLLAYADLMCSAGPRVDQLASRLYDDYLGKPA